jgi:isoleucyl-tRNA synthetase
VIDAWFDSGSMPFAQWGHPHAEAGRFEAAFPADFISEAIDQTRGWFYSLLAVNTLLFDQSPYRNVVCLGHLVDRDGRKMSKSLGNILDPFTLLDEFGADPLRWFMLASGSPWSPRRLFPEALAELSRGMFATLWNTASFFSLYARLEGFDPGAPGSGGETALDRWVLGELDRTVRTVTEALEAYDPTTASTAIAAFVDSLSNWYLRLSRRRFWRGVEAGDAAFRTLWECVRTVSLLLAPFTPFVAEALWQRLVVPVVPGAPDSVHLADWPAEAGNADAGLEAGMAEARRLVGLGRQARTEAKVRVRQPLGRALVTVPAGRRAAVGELLDLVAAELNVKSVEFASGDDGLVGYRLAPNFRALGPRFGKQVKGVADAIRNAEAAPVASALRGGGRVSLDVPGVGQVEVGPEDVEVHEVPVTGWRVASDGPNSVALDLELTPELRREGLARELVRAVQDLRKAAGLEVADRIELAVEAPGGGEAEQAVLAHADWLKGEVLALELHAGPGAARGDGWAEAQAELEDEPVRIALKRIEGDQAG